jgi:hypothetical protein
MPIRSGVGVACDLKHCKYLLVLENPQKCAIEITLSNCSSDFLGFLLPQMSKINVIGAENF